MKLFLYLSLFVAGLVCFLSCKEKLTIDPVRYASVRVRVVSYPDQKPISNALVALSPNNRILYTDAAGEGRFDSVTAGIYTLQAQKTDFVTQVATVSATVETTPTVTLLLANAATSFRYATVRGRVLSNTNQQPVPNARLTLAPNNRILNTDASGSFRFDSVLAGSYTLQIEKEGYVTQAADVVASVEATPPLTILVKEDIKVNTPPSIPVLVAPTLNSVVQSTTVTFKWKATDPDPADKLTYDLLLFKANATSPTLSFTGITADSLVVPNLEYGISYFWQVIVKDKVSAVNGPLWSFSTSIVPDFNYLFARPVDGQLQIFGANATGQAVQLTRTGSNWRPVASPNREQIAFISNARTNLHLFVMNTDGSNIRQVTTVPVAGLFASDLAFCWSPDGSQLLYPSNNQLYAINLNGTGLRSVAQAPGGRVFAGCDWTPQGGRIVARTTGSSVYDNQIMTFLPDGSDMRIVYTSPNRRVSNPAFSVTGNQLVFSADGSDFANAQGRQLDARIYLLDLGSNGLTDLSVFPVTSQSNPSQNNKPVGTNDLEPRFAPNGAQLIFTNTDNSDAGTPSVQTITISGNALDNRARKTLFTAAETPFWRRP